MTRQRQFTAKPIHVGANSRAKRNSFVNGVIMKKIICIILLLSILITALASCKGVTVIEEISETETGTEQTTTGQESETETGTVEEINHRFDWQYDYDFNYELASVDGDYIFNNAMASGYYMILKRNVHTGECTTVCTDPFCQHNSAECPFYGTSDVFGIGNTMYGTKHDDAAMKNVLYSYNVDTGKTEIIYETKSVIYDLTQYKYYLYFRPTDKGNMRLDTRTGQIEQVKPQSGYQLSFIRFDMIIWCMEINKDTGEKVYTATDLLGEDPRPYDPQIYKGKLHKSFSTNGIYTTVLQLDKDGNTEKTLVEKGRFPMIFGDQMIYLGVFPDGEPHPRDPDDPDKGTTVTNGDVYSVSLDTGETKLLCHIEEAEPYFWGFSSSNTLMCGDWAAINTPSNYPSGTDKIGTQSDMILVNVKTGEYHISRFIE